MSSGRNRIPSDAGVSGHGSSFDRALLLGAAFLLMAVAVGSCSRQATGEVELRGVEYYASSKPWTRWWWFAGDVDSTGVRRQLQWLKRNGFGGVEIAWVYPRQGRDVNRQPWLSPEWSAIVAYASRCADTLGLGCDFTFGTLWPFGDSMVPPEDAALTWAERERGAAAAMRLTWEHPLPGRVIDHLRRGPLDRYAARMLRGLDAALSLGRHGLFCDSWEVPTDGLWTPGLDSSFARAYGYDVRPSMDSLRSSGHEEVFYDYMKLLSQHVLKGFYGPFTRIAHARGAFSRVQCGGSPTDLLRAYGVVDVPETEALLFEPDFARIPASAAATGGKPVVSSETFTCLYGWKSWPGPGPKQGKEIVEDLKLLADALFASGVNHIVWHGMPYNASEKELYFYASVHVGRTGALSRHLPHFNSYMETVCHEMRKGHVFSDVAVYLPLEDAWMGVELPDSLRYPWAWGEYELRYQRMPGYLAGRQPLWVNADNLRKGRVEDGRLVIGDCRFSAVVVEATYLDLTTVRALRRVATLGVPVFLENLPRQPGRARSEAYGDEVDALLQLPATTRKRDGLFDSPPLLDGDDLPPYWCRVAEDGLRIFFAHPLAGEIRYPMEYAMSRHAAAVRRTVTLRWNNRNHSLDLRFPQHGSLLLHIDPLGTVRKLHTGWSTPVQE